MNKKHDEKNLDILKCTQNFTSHQRLGKPYWVHGRTNRSLFKFNLRTEPSYLSQVCYNEERFESLLYEFIQEVYSTFHYDCIERLFREEDLDIALSVTQ